MKTFNFFFTMVRQNFGEVGKFVFYVNYRIDWTTNDWMLDCDRRIAV